MSAQPWPHREGVILEERFALGPVLGRGGFGVTYLGEDLVRGGRVVVKELAPTGSIRSDDGQLDFSGLSPTTTARLRHQFTRESRILERLSVPHVPRVRASLHEFNTAYYVTDYVEGAQTLSQRLMIEGRLDADEVRTILEQLLETLDSLHRHGVLHRDIKPSNVLADPRGQVFLIDFGAAQQWHGEATHEILYTPGYAPPEQSDPRGRCGPPSDLYSLAATAYALLAGEPPPPATDRRDGAPLIGIRTLRPDVPPSLSRAIERALSLNFEDRPASAPEFRALLHADPDGVSEQATIEDLDARRLRLIQFRFDRRQCPSCGDVLEEPRPLRHDKCPVCRDGNIERRRIEPRICASCRTGVLHKRANSDPLTFCPSCQRSGFRLRRRLGRPPMLACPECAFTLTREKNGWSDAEGNTSSLDDWRRRAGRTVAVMECDGCAAQFDVMPDGRWRRMTVDRQQDGWSALFPDEWGRVAAGLDPGAGNAACDRCRADYHRDDDSLTLLADGGIDPYGFSEQHAGRRIAREDVPWLAVGKLSGHPGPVCRTCGTEFDRTPDGLSLVRSRHPQIRGLAGATKSLEDWHRLAQDVPAVGEEHNLEEALHQALVDAYVTGELTLAPGRPDVRWKGRAQTVTWTGTRPHFGAFGRLTVTGGELVFRSGLRRRQIDEDEIAETEAEGDLLTLHLRDEEAKPWSLRIEPIVLSVRLVSGRTTVTLNAEALARRLDADRRALRSQRLAVP